MKSISISIQSFTVAFAIQTLLFPTQWADAWMTGIGPFAMKTTMPKAMSIHQYGGYHQDPKFTSKTMIFASLRLSLNMVTQTDIDAMAFVAPSTDMATSLATPTPGSVVTIEARLVPEGDDFVPEPVMDGIVWHAEDPPVVLSFVLGQGHTLPGLHDVVAGLRVGEHVHNVSLDAGWGSYNPQLVYTLPLSSVASSSQSLLQVDTQLQLSNGMACVVTDINEKDGIFTMDCNHPLAGTSYLASVKLLKVEEGPSEIATYSRSNTSTSRYETAVFALGCFWGGELMYMREPGVVGTAVGYTRGGILPKSDNNNSNYDTLSNVPPPSYEQVCQGTTGFTEAIAVTYNPTIVSYERLVQMGMDRLGESKYLKDQVGNDKGTQYRHGVYYANPAQAEIAQRIVASYGNDCMTECMPATKFWRAEDYHQQYLLKGGQSARKGETAVIRCYG
jgi:peptide-methionine (S)-S-oxide reductase